MPAVSSSLAITRPVGSVMMSTSGVLWVCPAKSSGVLCQVLPPSVENRTIAGAVFSSPPAPSDSEAPSPLVTTHSVPSGPVVIRGSVHGTPGEIFWTLTLDHVVGAACADAAPAASPAMTMSTVPSRRAAVMTASPLDGRESTPRTWPGARPTDVGPLMHLGGGRKVPRHQSGWLPPLPSASFPGAW